MNFLENIFERLAKSADAAVLQEVRDARIELCTGGEFARLVGIARVFLARAGLRRGDRCALLANNSIRWAALDLALMAEGIVVVPLYARQSPAELAAMLRDAEASLVCCGDAALTSAIEKAWPGAPRRVLFEEVFAEAAAGADRLGARAGSAPVARDDAEPVTIIYTSGTSGEAKGVVLNVGNINHMLECTAARLDLLMGHGQEPDRVFHYLPFCFAGSWILLLTCLSRASVLTLSTDLNNLADEIRVAAPDYFLNVPTLLERIRSGVEEQLARRGGIARALFRKGSEAWERRLAGKTQAGDALWLGLADRVVFFQVRKRLGPNLRALICGSAPLARETQLFFLMLGVRVLQVYGLTETTAICTMDDPQRIEPGYVGPAIPEIEMKLGENHEILVRGPNIFPGYWNRPQETSEVLRDGWFHTGDQGEVNAMGNWRITGRLKDLIILRSGHNIAPEPIEEKLLRGIPGAQQVVLVGNGQSYLAAIVTGGVAHDSVAAAVEALNRELPHYKQVRAFHIEAEPLTIGNGLLTANGKLKREAIAARFAAEIESVYQRDEKAGAALDEGKRALQR